MEILRWSESMRDRDHPMGKKTLFLILLSLHTFWTLTRLVMRIGGRCCDLRVMLCLCCEWLECCRCNHAWPFKIACGQWLALCRLLCLQASPPGASCHRDQGEVQMFPAALPNFIVSLPVFTAAWYDLTPIKTAPRVPGVLYTSVTPRHVRPVWCWCWMSVISFFCLPLPTQLTCCSFKWPDILPYSEIFYFSLTFVRKFTSDQTPYVNRKKYK